MKKTDIKEIYKQCSKLDGQTVNVGGWVRSVRDSKNFGFIDLNDGTTFKGVQIVFEPQNIDNYAEVAKLNAGSSIMCEGTLVLTPENKQPFEIKAKTVEIVGATPSEYPLQTYLTLYLDLEAKLHLLFIAFLNKKTLLMFIHQLLQVLTAKVVATYLE